MKRNQNMSLTDRQRKYELHTYPYKFLFISVLTVPTSHLSHYSQNTLIPFIGPHICMI